MGMRSKVFSRVALHAVAVGVLFLLGASARIQAADLVIAPGLSCPDAHGGILQNNNDQVLNWKYSTRNAFLARGHVNGTIVAILPSAPSHIRFVIRIGKHYSPRNLCASDAVEVIYNRQFGDVDPKDLYLGAQVEACGDYITANAPNGRYKASPACALVHWVHINPKRGPHVAGYLSVNGITYGRLYSGH